jgi:hypothetical protein
MPDELDRFTTEQCVESFKLFLTNIRNHTDPHNYQQFLLQVQEYLGPQE